MRTTRLLPLGGLLLSLLLGACHPLSCWYPAGLPTDQPKELTSTSSDFPAAPVEVLFDNLGIPHIYGESETDLSYALGWVHGRDRLFQAVFRKAAAEGRLMELFGDPESNLKKDQHQRLLVWNLDEAFALLSDRDLALCEAYAAGLNDSHTEHGDTAEMTLLGLTAGYQWEDFSAWDVLATMRLLQDNQSTGWEEALAWDRLLRKLGRDNPLLDEIPVRIDALGNPVITDDEFTGEPYPGDVRPAPRTARQVAELLPPGKYEVAEDFSPRKKGTAPEMSAWMRRKLNGGFPGEGGASNSWAVSGEHTASGNPMFSNDPHMDHDQTWNLVDLEAPDFAIAGVSFAGVPAIIIGHSRSGAWGLTNPTTVNEELLRMELAEGRDDAYMLDGEVVPFETLEQQYFTAGEDEPVHTEQWRITEFGPMVPPGREFYFEEGEDFVFKSTQQHYIDAPGFISSFWDIARARTSGEVLAAAERFTGPPINLPYALNDGTIGWALLGFFPQLQDDIPPWLPRDGTRRTGEWGDRIPFRFHPQTVNPAKGWLTASNQRLVEEGGPLDWYIGPRGDDGYRALQINKRITQAITEGKPTTLQLGAIQQDVYSNQAELLAPIFAEHCPTSIAGQPDQLVEALCAELRRFDFRFYTTSRGALVFDYLVREVFRHTAYAHLGTELGDDWWNLISWKRGITNAFVAYADGEQPLLLDHPGTDGYDGPDFFVARAAKSVLTQLRTELGDDPELWTWGRVNKLDMPGLLSASGQIGFLFHTDEWPQPGCGECVRAEKSKKKVPFGSALRMIVELGNPVQGRIVNDLGQAEQFGHKHKQDLQPLWQNGNPPVVMAPRREVEEQLEGWAKLNPAP